MNTELTLAQSSAKIFALSLGQKVQLAAPSFSADPVAMLHCPPSAHPH
jgi:hypothetical protein